MGVLEEMKQEELTELKKEIALLKEEIDEGLKEESNSEYHQYMAIVVEKIESLITETNDLTEIDLPKEVEFAAYFCLLNEMQVGEEDFDFFDELEEELVLDQSKGK